MKRIAMALVALSLTAAGVPTAPAADLSIEVAGLRNAKGKVHLCLTQSATRFLKCKDDKGAIARTLTVGQARKIDLGPVKPGQYALLIVHDENANGRLDMMMGIPREGFGFSNNPAMKARAPRWEEIRFTMPATAMRQQVRIRYVL